MVFCLADGGYGNELTYQVYRTGEAQWHVGLSSLGAGCFIRFAQSLARDLVGPRARRARSAAPEMVGVRGVRFQNRLNEEERSSKMGELETDIKDTKKLLLLFLLFWYFNFLRHSEGVSSSGGDLVI